MCIQNRRYREVLVEIKKYEDLLDASESISDCMHYSSKLEWLNQEKEEIEERYR